MIKLVGGKYKGKKWPINGFNGVRPTKSIVRESVFNMILARYRFQDCMFVDAFAGTGIMGLEALSRGFNEVVWIETDTDNFKLLVKRLESVTEIKQNGSKKYTVVNMDCLKYLPNIQSQSKRGVVFFDPPYQNENLYKGIGRLGFSEKITDIFVEGPLNIDLFPLKAANVKSYGSSSIYYITNSI